MIFNHGEQEEKGLVLDNFKQRLNRYDMVVICESTVTVNIAVVGMYFDTYVLTLERNVEPEKAFVIFHRPTVFDELDRIYDRMEIVLNNLDKKQNYTIHSIVKIDQPTDEMQILKNTILEKIKDKHAKTGPNASQLCINSIRSDLERIEAEYRMQQRINGMNERRQRRAQLRQINMVSDISNMGIAGEEQEYNNDNIGITEANMRINNGLTIKNKNSNN